MKERGKSVKAFHQTPHLKLKKVQKRRKIERTLKKVIKKEAENIEAEVGVKEVRAEIELNTEVEVLVNLVDPEVFRIVLHKVEVVIKKKDKKKKANTKKIEIRILQEKVKIH